MPDHVHAAQHMTLDRGRAARMGARGPERARQVLGRTCSCHQAARPASAFTATACRKGRMKRRCSSSCTAAVMRERSGQSAPKLPLQLVGAGDALAVQHFTCWPTHGRQRQAHTDDGAVRVRGQFPGPLAARAGCQVWRSESDIRAASVVAAKGPAVRCGSSGSFCKFTHQVRLLQAINRPTQSAPEIQPSCRWPGHPGSRERIGKRGPAALRPRRTSASRCRPASARRRGAPARRP